MALDSATNHPVSRIWVEIGERSMLTLGPSIEGPSVNILISRTYLVIQMLE